MENSQTDRRLKWAIFWLVVVSGLTLVTSYLVIRSILVSGDLRLAMPGVFAWSTWIMTFFGTIRVWKRKNSTR